MQAVLNICYYFLSDIETCLYKLQTSLPLHEGKLNIIFLFPGCHWYILGQNFRMSLVVIIYNTKNTHTGLFMVSTMSS